MCIATATPSRTKYILKSSYLNWCGLFLWVIFMAIEKVNLATPGGDTARSAFTKINANFTGPAHAASRLVGTSSGDVVELTANGIAGLGYGATALPIVEGDLNTHSEKTWLFKGQNLENQPSVAVGWYYYDTQVHSASHAVQFAHHITSTTSSVRRKIGGSWGEWYPLNTNKVTYDTTTAASPNVAVDAAGRLTRTSSSERYKDIIADLELDDENYADAMSLNPIVYRSKSDIDNPNYHFYSFSAEALGAHDPAFTLWRDTNETVTDDEGNTTEQPLNERVAEGINLNAIVAFLHATNIKQGKIIADLEQRLSSLETPPEV